MTDFATTHWSLIYAARSQDRASASVALAQLCERYRPAVLAFAHNLCRAPQEAEDLTQGFFTKLLEQRIDEKADPERGRFRSFLKAAIANYFRSDLEAQRSQKRSAHDEIPEPSSAQTPEQAFDHAWAKVVIKRSLGHLRDEARSTQKGELFDLVRPFLIGGSNRGDYQQAASLCGMRPNTFAVHVHRMKQRLRELIRQELTDTVANQEELNLELRELRQPIAA
jgi:RNA polymerase sigma factor (sigma-70 family)